MAKLRAKYCLIIGACILLSIEMEVFSDDGENDTDRVAPRDINRATPREISVAARMAPKVIDGTATNFHIIRLLNKNRRFSNRQLLAMSPLLSQQILEASRQGDIYELSESNPDKVYFEIPPTYAVSPKDDLFAELINSKGKPIEFDLDTETQVKKWVVWKYQYRAHAVLLPLDVPCEGCPLVERAKLEELGVTLHMYQYDGKSKVTLATIPLYPFSE